MASVACRFIPVILVQMGCSLNKEKSKQCGKGQDRCSAQALPEPMLACSRVPLLAELRHELATHGATPVKRRLRGRRLRTKRDSRKSPGTSAISIRQPPRSRKAFACHFRPQWKERPDRKSVV